ncbi:GumC family protein [Parvularcula maris]|uniref:Lipopolysaccharide biosynthesis protein n=1 Tax=Parvularcula maris TaxID=2965077 RepID=A0A9X2RGH5_9PROT|nr:hypothetical protein [Parvularcula maris]MCQ8184005.1 hypothetical protein [Parvularcula maris]
MERYDIGDFIRIGLRRFFWMLIPFLVALTIGLVVLGTIPERYHSRALLIVTDQQVSQDLVPSAVQAIAQDRLETIKAEIRARDNVVELARKFDLFDRDSKKPFSAQVVDVRDDIRISIEKIDNRRRRSDEPSTITFEIGFVHENPQTAFRVANQVVTDFLAENVEARIEAAEGTAEFFRTEARDQQRRLDDIRREIADVRNENAGLTPESLSYNQSVYERLRDEMQRLEERVESSNQSLALMRVQQPLIIDANERSDLERVTLNEKRRQLLSLKSQFTETYPGVIALTGEVLELEARLDPRAFERRSQSLISGLNTRLRSDDLSDSQRAELEERRQDLRAQLADARAQGGQSSLARLQFETNEQQLMQRIESDEARLEELRTELDEAEDRIARMPRVAARLDVLETEEERILRLLERTQGKLATAEQSESLEAQQKAERVEILESAVLPDTPTAPDKPAVAIMLAGASGGLAAAIGLLPVLLMPKVDSGRQMGLSLPGVTVVEVPEIVDEEEQKFRRTVMIALVLVSVLLAALCGYIAYRVLL